MTALITLAFAFTAPAQAAANLQAAVAAIRKADYQGDCKALERLFHETDLFLSQGKMVRYWRGFAMWRKAINGMNDHVGPDVSEKDLTRAVNEFDAAIALDGHFSDAKIGDASCLLMLSYLTPAKKQDPKQEIARALQLLRESRIEDPGNPRFYWVNGSGIWFVPAERGGGQARAMEGYLKALDLCHEQARKQRGPLDPDWGEPELLMSLAWSNLNKTAPDVAAAERYAKEALKIVPYWHYVRDILLPQILKANR